MARIRSVHPDICASEKLAELPAELERTFVRLWTYLDDQGRGKDEARLIKAAIYPMHDSIDWKRVEDDLDKLAKFGLLIRWTDGMKFVACRPESWDLYQHVQRPKESVYPVPPGYTKTDYRPQGQRIPYHSSGACKNDTCTVIACSAAIHDGSVKLHDDYTTVVVVSSSSKELVDVASNTRRRPETTVPTDFALTDEMREWAKTNDYDYLNLKTETAKFTNHAMQNERRCRDWVHAWRNWIIISSEKKPKPTHKTSGSTPVARGADRLHYCDKCHDYHEPSKPCGRVREAEIVTLPND